MVLKNFNAPDHLPTPWGGGWTCDTDPTRKGWDCRKAPSAFADAHPVALVYLVGQRGQRGCASFYEDTDRDHYVVTLHPDTPIEAAPHRSYGDSFRVESIPGFALYIKGRIEEMRSHLVAE